MRIEVIERMVLRARTVNPNVVPGPIIRLLAEMATALEDGLRVRGDAVLVARTEMRARCINALCCHCEAGTELQVRPDWVGHVRDGKRICECPARNLHEVAP